MTKDFKSLVEQIQKTATPPPAEALGPGARPVPAPAPPTPGGAAPTGRAGIPGNPEIAKMQSAMINLAKNVTSQLNLKALTSESPRQQQEAGGRDSFGDFLTKHFMRNSNVPAVEFSPDPTKINIKDKDPRAASKLSWVMDTMARIGGHSNEFTVDGRWGPRTSAALDNVAAFANGLFSMAEAFGVHSKTYNQEFFKTFQNVVGKQNNLSLAEKIEISDKITQHINAISKMYNEIKEKVLQTPQYQTYIEKDTPYLQHDKPEGEFTPSADQLASLRKTYPQGFDVYTGNDEQGNRVSRKISVDDLVSLPALTQWMKNEDVNQDPGEIVKQITNQVGSV